MATLIGKIYEYISWSNETAHHPSVQNAFTIPDSVDRNTSFEIKFSSRKAWAEPFTNASSSGFWTATRSNGSLNINYFNDVAKEYYDAASTEIIKYENNKVYINGVLEATCSVPDSTANGIIINSSRYGDNANGIIIYYIKIWQEGVLTRDIVPMLYNSTVGMYDKVQGTFFADAKGTASLVNFVSNYNSYTVTASKSPSAGGTVSGSGNYGPGKTVTLKATAASGYIFSYWSLNGYSVGNTSTISFTMGSSDVTYVANFNSYSSQTTTDLGNVTINATGDYAYNYYCNAKAYRIRTSDGTYYLKVTGKWYSKGNNVSGNVTAFSTNINVGAQTAQVAVPCNCFYNTTSDTVNRYSVYNGKVTTDGTLYLTIGHENCYRTFNQYDYAQEMIMLSPVTYSVSATVSPSGAGNVTGTGNYINGESVTVRATPGNGYYFSHWTLGGSTVSSSAEYTFTMGSSAKALSAVFVSYKTVTINTSGRGTATGSGNYDTGATASLTATAITGSHFVGWYNGSTLVSSNSSYSFTVNSNITLTAKFEYDYTFALSYNSSEGSPTFSRSYENGNVVYLEGNPLGTHFSGWYLGQALLSENSSYSYTLTGNTTITAQYSNIFSVTTVVEGNGSVSYVRSGDENTITFTPVPDQHYHLLKFEIPNYSGYLLKGEGEYLLNASKSKYVIDRYDAEFTDNPLTISISQDVIVYVYFEEDPKIHLSLFTSIENASIYCSVNDQYDPFTTTIWARPYPNYKFYKWSDGSYLNPRNLYVSENSSIRAEYKIDNESDSIYQYHCFVKDQSAMTEVPKAFMVVDSLNVRRDLMTNANSTFQVTNPPDSIDEGDVLVLYDPKGTTLYSGVITKIQPISVSRNKKMLVEEKQITCSQMPSFYKGNWVYEKGDTPPSSYDSSWKWEKYSLLSSNYPLLDEFEALTPSATNTYADSSISPTMNLGNNYSAKCTLYVWCKKPINTSLTVITNDNGSVWINGVNAGLINANTATMCSMSFVKGLNELVVCYNEASSSDGWNCYLNYESFPIYDSNKTYAVNDYCSYNDKIYKCSTAITTPEKWNSSHWTQVSSTLRITALPDVLGITSSKSSQYYLEESIANIVNYYSSGYIVGSDYTDTQVSQRLGGITVQYTNSTLNVSLPTQDVGSTMDFEEFIYYLYDKYGIVFDFEINVSGSNYLTIKVPSYDSIKVSDNMYAIDNLKVTTSVEETNRLIIFGSDNVTYRDTWIATELGTFQVDSIDAGPRFEITNTEIVFSDDPISDLVANYLPSQMFNHEIEFTLIMKNFVYDFGEFHLGMPLEIYNITDYYDSTLTGYEFKKERNKNIIEANLICGKIRQKITQLLTMKKV